MECRAVGEAEADLVMSCDYEVTYFERSSVSECENDIAIKRTIFEMTGCELTPKRAMKKAQKVPRGNSFMNILKSKK